MKFLDIFLKDKEYKSCEWIEYGIHFSPLGLDYCCMYNPNSNIEEPVVPIRNWKFNQNEFFKKKKKAIQNHQKGIIERKCIGCYNLKQRIWTKEKKIMFLVLNLNYKCNSDCVYCFTHKFKRIFNLLRDIPVYDILVKLIKKNKIAKNCEIHLGGGEPVLSIEFEKIVNLFLDNEFNNLKIYTSGIQYSQAIERVLKNDAGIVFISIDSANQELYKRIKGVDKFNQVIENSEQYIKMQGLNKNALALKYIIIPQLNDNIDDIKQYLDLVLNLNCKTIITDIERNWYDENFQNKELLKKQLFFIKYIEVFSIKNNINFIHFPASVYAINNDKEYYNSIQIEM